MRALPSLALATVLAVSPGCALGSPETERSAAPDPLASLPEGWTELPRPPASRGGAAVVWTGGGLVYWGGEDGGTQARADGWRLDARSRRWSPVAAGPLAARAWAAAVWTGEEAIVWGGEDGPRRLGDGAAYDPETDTWRPLPPAPIGARTPAAWAWTGSELVVSGDAGRTTAARDGAAYDPRRDRWRRLADAPFALNEATAAWTGTELIAVGAQLDGSNHSRSRQARALAYHPAADRWRALRDQPLSPQASSVAWDGTRLVAWDYELRARTYNPAAERWAWVPRLPLDFSECYPRSVTVGAAVLAWYCGQAAVRLHPDGPWLRVDLPVPDLGAEPVAAGAAALLVGSAGGEPALWAYRPPDRPPSVELVRTPPRRLAECRHSPLLRPACPAVVPVAAGVFRSLLDRDGGAHVFSLDHGGEWPGKPRWNRPPALVHVVLAGGDLGRAAPGGDPPCARHEPLADGVVHRERTGAVCFGPLRAGARSGDVFLAPPYPAGGTIGDHLVFRWRERGRRFALSLHAWEPLTETARALRQLARATG